jgi:hypothetical protein
MNYEKIKFINLFKIYKLEKIIDCLKIKEIGKLAYLHRFSRSLLILLILQDFYSQAQTRPLKFTIEPEIINFTVSLNFTVN